MPTSGASLVAPSGEPRTRTALLLESIALRHQIAVLERCGGLFFAIKPVRSASTPSSCRRDTRARMVSTVGPHTVRDSADWDGRYWAQTRPWPTTDRPQRSKNWPAVRPVRASRYSSNVSAGRSSAKSTVQSSGITKTAIARDLGSYFPRGAGFEKLQSQFWVGCITNMSGFKF
jgi:hypothetical protein